MLLATSIVYAFMVQIPKCEMVVTFYQCQQHVTMTINRSPEDVWWPLCFCHDEQLLSAGQPCSVCLEQDDFKMLTSCLCDGAIMLEYNGQLARRVLLSYSESGIMGIQQKYPDNLAIDLYCPAQFIYYDLGTGITTGKSRVYGMYLYYDL